MVQYARVSECNLNVNVIVNAEVWSAGGAAFIYKESTYPTYLPRCAAAMERIISL